MTIAETERRLSTTDVAKIIRGELRAGFPGVKFSVRSKSYAGGSSIDVGWTDGPTTGEVDAIVKRYEGATFDGMRDLKEYRDPTLLANPDGSYEHVSYGVDYILTHRTIGTEWRAEIGAMIAAATGEPCNLADNQSPSWNHRYAADAFGGTYSEEGAPRIVPFGGGHLEYAGTIMHRYAQRVSRPES